MRHIAKNRIRRDASGHVVGINSQAFRTRPTDNGALSVNWLEWFRKPTENDNIKVSIHVLRNTRNIGPHDAFGIGQVKKIKEVCRSRSKQVRIVHAPSRENPAHSTILRLEQDDIILQEALADEAFCQLIQNKDI
ncbi:MAG: hypothetical protein ABTQ34_02970 [Bdellovibrionales bacterium]